ncbi:MAG: TVP38/TMEM64 family protein [Clostridia bacterium]
MENKDRNFKRVINIISIVGTILMCIFFYFALKEQIFTSEEKMKLFLEKSGYFAPILFVIIQIVQVVIPIIPGGISQGVGVLIFGPLWGFIYNYVGIVLGSIIVFFIARKYGMPLIKKMFRKELIDKYIGWINNGKKFEIFFAIAIFLPVAPDDFLCYLAGVTDISIKKYIAIILLLKPFTISAYSFILVFVSNLLFKIM